VATADASLAGRIDGGHILSMGAAPQTLPQGGANNGNSDQVTRCRVPKFWMRKGNCLSGHAIANAIERDGTHRLNPISNLPRADVMRIIPDNIGRLPVSAP
jgi:hypothetical protein